VWNIRDSWKAQENARSTCSNIRIPVEIRNDVAIIDEALRGQGYGGNRGTSLRAMAKKVTKEGRKASRRSLGLAAFNAEQVIAMSVSPKTQRANMDGLVSQDQAH
jgi:hypothetical protein